MVYRSGHVSVNDTSAYCPRFVVVGSGVVVVMGCFVVLGAIERVLADMAYTHEFRYQ